MIFLIDSGNTNTKLALISSEGIELIARVKSNELHFLTPHLRNNRIDVFVSTVVSQEEALLKICSSEKRKVKFLSSNSVLPFQTSYPLDSLGDDRKALLAGAQSKFPKTNTFIISAGTCITMDLISKEGVHLGGRISPGLNMRFQAMNHFTKGLPLIKPHNDYDFLGLDTESSIRSGVQLGIIEEIEGTISILKAQFSDLKLILSGGDYAFFEKLIKVEIFADPLLLFKGLYEIYKLNAWK